MDGHNSIPHIAPFNRLHYRTGEVCRSVLLLTGLLSFSGCVLPAGSILGAHKSEKNAEATPAAGCTNCTKPDCGAPAAAGAALTTMPVIPHQASNGQQQAAAGNQGQVPELHVHVPSAAGQTNGMQTNGMQANMIPNTVFYPAPVTPGQSQFFPPPGYKIVPDTGIVMHPGAYAPPAQGQLPTTVPPAAPAMPSIVAETNSRLENGWPAATNHSAASVNGLDPAAAATGPVREKLLQCEKQVSEMNTQVLAMKELHAMTRDEIRQMSQEQRLLKIENDQLRLKLEKSNEQYIQSFDSLSQILEEGVTSSSNASGATTDTGSRQKSRASETGNLLPPAVESEL